MTERVVLENTLRGRGFAREIDGKYHGPDWLRPERPRRPRFVWLAALAACVAALAGLAWALPSLLAAAIEVGDWLGITARQR